ncbi:MAG: biosynthetic-type acetolactate synthase large subunit [Steroidobacteraceae bacterium]
MQISGADLVIQLLEQCGVRTVAGIPGGALLPLYAALSRSTLIRHVLARHEQAAGFIAQGIARVTGKAGVCFATSGPGVTNIVTALADAKLDSIPLVCIAGQVPTALIGTDAFQEVPTIDMVRPITKASFFVRDAAELFTVIPRAFQLANGGRPGPVLIDLPKDVQQQVVDTSTVTKQMPLIDDGCSTEANARQIAAYDAAATMIASARRPLLYIGGGVIKAGAQEALRRFVLRTGFPVTTTLMALGVLDADSPHNTGMLGMHGARHTNLVIDECDVLIAIGARFDDRATGNTQHFAARASIIHIDIDARELGKIKQPAIAICDDALVAITKLLERDCGSCPDAWTARVQQLRHSHPLQTPLVDQVCSPYGIIRAVGELAPANAMIATDVGQHQMWVAQTYPFARATRWLTSGGLGTMGFGLPAAIGAALADPAAMAICFSGDGSLMMNIQEFATLAELGLNVKIILLDNGGFGLVRQQQELFYARRFVASVFERPSDLVAIARAFGIAAVDVARSHSPTSALRAAMSASGPMLIRVPVDVSHHVLPMVAPGAANIDALDYPARDACAVIAAGQEPVEAMT